MTIRANDGGPLLLQGTSDTNPTTTAENKLTDKVFSSGVDGLLEFYRQYELAGGDNFANVFEWRGDHYGYHANTFTTGTAGNGIMGFLDNSQPLSYGVPIGNFRANSLSNLGIITSPYNGTTFSDGGGTTRTITSITWGIPDASPSPNNADRWFMFALNGTSISDSDTTFKSIKVKSSSGSFQTFTRSSRTRYQSNNNGDTCWLWLATSSSSSIDNIGTSGSNFEIEIYGPDTTVTRNTGIAEEFGGADSSDVALSHYYKGASTEYVVDGATTQAIPSSGEISFSDFYNATYIAPTNNLAEGSFTSTYSVGQYVTTSGWSFNSAISPSNSTLDDGFDSALRGNGSGNVALNGIYNLNGGVIYVYFKRTNNSTGTFTDTGWSNLRIYLNQTDNSGSPDLTLTRTGATGFSAGSSSGNSGYYYFTATRAMSTYFGTNSNETHYVELD